MKLSPEWVARLTLVNTILLSCILVLLLFNMTTVQPPPTTSEVLDGGATGSLPGGGYGGGSAPPSDIKKIIDDTLFPLERAIIDHEGNPNEILPSGEEIDAAVNTGNLGSAESQLVIEKLKKGYALYKMPFPNLAPPPSSEMSPQQRTTEQRKEFEAWVRPTIERLRVELEAKGEDASILLPTDQDLAAAFESASFTSTESRNVIDILKAGYARMQLKFPTPEQMDSPGATGPESQIVKAYFMGQLQRLDLEAKKRSEDISTCKPSRKDVKKAISSGDISSQESKYVLLQLEKCYDALGIQFYPPISNP